MPAFRIQGITATAAAQIFRRTAPIDFGVWSGEAVADAIAAFERDAKVLRGQHGRSSGPGILWDYMRAGGTFEAVALEGGAEQAFTIGGGA